MDSRVRRRGLFDLGQPRPHQDRKASAKSSDWGRRDRADTLWRPSRGSATEPDDDGDYRTAEAAAPKAKKPRQKERADERAAALEDAA